MHKDLQVGTSEAPQGIQNIHLGLAKIAHDSSEIHTLFVRWTSGYAFQTTMN